MYASLEYKENVQENTVNKLSINKPIKQSQQPSACPNEGFPIVLTPILSKL